LRYEIRAICGARFFHGPDENRSVKILLASHFFHPSVGGIEEVSRVLATEFSRAGHEVKVATTTREDDGAIFSFEIVRCPDPLRLLALARWCDVFFHNNISLRAAWPLLFVRRPWVIAHHTWIERVRTNRTGLRDWIKHRVVRRAKNIAVSAAVARHVVRVPSVVIGNPYRDELFVRDASATRDRDLVFLGRLVTDKGVDLLLDAMAVLKMENRAPTLTVIGDGPERKNLERQAESMGLGSGIFFAGKKPARNLSRC
jgi:glycogen synthase